MLNYFFLIIPLIYIFIYKRFWDKRLFESVVFGLIMFFGVNSFYFFVVSIFNLELSILVLFILNLGYCLLFYFAGKKNKSKLKGNKNDNNYELMVVMSAILLIILFVINLKTFSNGFRIPIPSFTEDASQHFHHVLEPLRIDKLIGGFYPLTFHGNGWLFIKLATQIFGIDNDFVFITNVFSLYIWLILFLTISLVSVIVLDLVSIKKNNLTIQIIIPFFTLIIGSVVSFYFIEYGFFSNWLNQLFSLAIIYLVSRDEPKSIVLFLPLIFGFFFSYSFFIPILIVFFGYLFFLKKEKIYLQLLLIGLFLAIIFSLELLFTSGIVGYLITAGGGFPTYTVSTVLLYILLCYFYYFYIKNNKNKPKILEYLSTFGGFFVLYAVGLAVMQLILNGKISYSFHKVFASSFLLFGVLATAGCVFLVSNVFSEKKEGLSSTLFFLKSTTLILLITIITAFTNPSLVNIFQGKGNFFSNSREKFNSVIFALENFSNYKNVIYIDGDYQSTRWATLSYLPTRFNVIYDQNDVTNYKNYNYYISQIKQISSNILILNPNRFLDVDCDAENFINVATQSANVLIYPFDLDNFNRNCHGYF